MHYIKSNNIDEIMILLLIFCIVILVIWLRSLTKQVSKLESELRKHEAIIRKQAHLNVLIGNELKKGEEK